jgi:hypothetical protein
MTTYPQKVTFGEMRASGVRDVLIYWAIGLVVLVAGVVLLAIDVSNAHAARG